MERRVSWRHWGRICRGLRYRYLYTVKFDLTFTYKWRYTNETQATIFLAEVKQNAAWSYFRQFWPSIPFWPWKTFSFFWIEIYEMNHILNSGQRHESEHDLRGRMKVTFTFKTFSINHIGIETSVPVDFYCITLSVLGVQILLSGCLLPCSFNCYWTLFFAVQIPYCLVAKKQTYNENYWVIKL